MAKKGNQVKTSVDTTRKKKKVFDVDNNIKVAYKTGQIIYGRNQVMRHLRQDSFKMIIVANNCPTELLSELKYYNRISTNDIFIHRYKGSSWDLGLVCAVPYMISIIGVIDPGDSDLLTLITKGRS